MSSCRATNANEVLPVSDPKLVEAVLGEEWEATGLRPRIIAVHIAADPTPGSAAVLERNRQAALGHRALQAVARFFSGDQHDPRKLVEELRAAHEELRGGK